MISIKHNILIVGLWFIIALLTLLVFVKFFTIVSFWSFAGETSRDTGTGVKVSMGVDTKIKKTLSGLLAKSTSPYDLDVGFYTDQPEPNLKAVIIQNITIQYEHEQKVELVGGKNEMILLFVVQKSPNWEGNGIVYHESIAAGDTLTNCIDKNLPFIVNCQSKLLRKSGEEIPITFQWNFKPKRRLGVVPSYLDPEIAKSPFPKP